MKKQLSLLLFFVCAVFLFFQNTRSFRDPDSFYHAAIVEEIIQSPRHFPTLGALPFTTLEENYIDHHYGYHLIVAAITQICATTFVGLKAATVFFGIGVFGVLFLVIRSLHGHNPLLWSVIALVDRTFLFRLNLAKAPGLSLIFFLTGVWAAVQRKYVLLSVISFLYVWMYGGWIILPLVIGVYSIGEALGEAAYEKNTTALRAIFAQLTSLERRKVWAHLLGGIGAGIVVNPFFPENLSFFYDQAVRIGLLGQGTSIGVGAEWYNFSPAAFLDANIIFCVAFFISSAVFIIRFRHHTKQTIGFLFIFLFLFVAAMKSIRNIEYLVPAAMVFFSHVFRTVDSASVMKYIQEKIPYPRRVVMGAMLVVCVGYTVLRDTAWLRQSLGRGLPFSYLAQEAEWLRTHTTPGTVVFHSNWDEFPALYYFNRQNRYIVGLDPRFLYFRDPERYTLWRDITTGVYADNLREGIARFSSTAVVVSKNHTKFEFNLIADGFTKVFEGSDASIYVISKSRGGT